ncbi:MAG: fructosamine kinase family protein [Acidimicrobiales bacterium]
MLLERLADGLGAAVRSARPVAGGDVSRAYRLELVDGRVVFAKTHPSPPDDFYSTEAASLAWLAAAGVLAVPRVLAHGDDPPAFIVLEWIEPGGIADAQTDAEFGRALALLHRSGAPSFGRDDKKTLGSLGLPTGPCPSWPEFYVTQRLEPLVAVAEERDALPRELLREIGRVASRIEILAGPREPAARLHGDLWGGNRMIDAEGRNWLIDPAAHGGHREYDLAMMRLFGGFGESCFAAYDELFPVMDGWTKRLPLHQLAPLMVHAIKFGGHYVGRVEQALLQLR